MDTLQPPKRVTLYFPPDLKDAMQRIAKRSQRSFNAQIVFLLRRHVEADRRQQQERDS